VKARNTSRIVIITTMLTTFVLYLCASVSNILPFFFVAALVVILAACLSTQPQAFAAIIRCTQKRE
jgi:hypothetical protein